jgi:hypothetical protein
MGILKKKTYKLKENINENILARYGFEIIPEGIYAKSMDCFFTHLGDREEIFCTLEKDRTFKKFFVVSYLRNVYEQKELKLRKKDIKELIDAEMVEIIWR